MLLKKIDKIITLESNQMASDYRWISIPYIYGAKQVITIHVLLFCSLAVKNREMHAGSLCGVVNSVFPGHSSQL